MSPILNGYHYASLLINALLRSAPMEGHTLHATLNKLPRDVSKLQTYHLHFHALIAATVLATAVQKSTPQNTTTVS
jgi:hypothetical protein